MKSILLVKLFFFGVIIWSNLCPLVSENMYFWPPIYIMHVYNSQSFQANLVFLLLQCLTVPVCAFFLLGMDVQETENFSLDSINFVVS